MATFQAFRSSRDRVNTVLKQLTVFFGNAIIIFDIPIWGIRR